MKNTIVVKVVPFAKQVRIEPMLTGLKVWLTERPEGGAANQQLVEVLAKHFDVPKSAVTIQSGHTGRIKLIHILS